MNYNCIFCNNLLSNVIKHGLFDLICINCDGDFDNELPLYAMTFVKNNIFEQTIGFNNNYIIIVYADNNIITVVINYDIIDKKLHENLITYNQQTSLENIKIIYDKYIKFINIS